MTMKIHILPHIHAQIMHYVDKCSGEVSGLGRVQKNSAGELVVTKVYLLDQEVGAAHTDIDAEAVAKLMFETREDQGDLTFWWHSHVNMGTFWSGEDMKTIKEFGKNGYLLASVFNKKGDMRTAIYMAGDTFRPDIFLDSLPTFTAFIPSKAETDAWDAEIKSKVRTKVYTPVASHWNTNPRSLYGLGDASTPSAFNDPFYWGDDIPVAKKHAAPKSKAGSKLLPDTILDNTQMTATEVYEAVSALIRTKREIDTLKAPALDAAMDFYTMMFGADAFYNYDDFEEFWKDAITDDIVGESYIRDMADMINSGAYYYTPTFQSAKPKKKKSGRKPAKETV